MVPDQASVVVPSSVVASVSTYADAQQTVGYLRSYGMDSRSLEVVGAELRLSRRQAAVPVVRRTLMSAGAGALLGVLSGVFVTLVAETTLTAFSVLLWGFVYGVLVGAMWGLFQGLVRNRPDAPAVEVITPSYYEVRCAVEDVSVALSLLGTEAEPERFVEPEPERLAEPEPERFVEPQPQPEPVAKSGYLVEPPQQVVEPEPEPVAESKPVPDEVPPVRRQPAQTSRKARAKKKTARTNAA